ncbi:hypothetical protein JG688_00004104 [Phytophthora aleatoria]|uniref:Uncharacterized protein n=1 Tax=Phytophthora aleatoria TaxID=2496075 RepID=A0A8J5J3T6_9STRA|nr:hypothetical protein JG688_00004104 [Phytophthora aleatoria]
MLPADLSDPSQWKRLCELRFLMKKFELKASALGLAKTSLSFADAANVFQSANMPSSCRVQHKPAGNGVGDSLFEFQLQYFCFGTVMHVFNLASISLCMGINCKSILHPEFILKTPPNSKSTAIW